MNDMAYCGLDCGRCEHRASTGCPGCRASGGKMFWGECVIAQCCIRKGIDHCGQCGQLPCEHVIAFAYDSAHGDQGRRIETLRAACKPGE